MENSMDSARITKRKLVYDDWYKLYQIVIQLPDGVLTPRHLLDSGSAVAVLPYDPDRRVCMLIKQPRAPVLAAGEASLYEAIAGRLDGASPEDRIVEEALEEGGLRLSKFLEPITNMWSLSPLSTERVQLYLSTYRADDRVAEGGGAHDENEAISVHEISLDSLRQMVLSGELTDAKTLILAQALLLRHPDLWN
jgi:nudix-type nucleoside diphosphatase (YffH/AdpP family)